MNKIVLSYHVKTLNEMMNMLCKNEERLARVKSILICNQVESKKEAIRAHQKKILKNKRKEAEVFQFTREDFEKKYGNCLTTQHNLNCQEHQIEQLELMCRVLKVFLQQKK